MTDPGAPHLAENFILELAWIVSFGVSLVFGAIQVSMARTYEAARQRLKANGPALLESRLLMRRAVIRMLVSATALIIGVASFLTPDAPISNQAYVVAFLILAVGYAAPAVLEVFYSRRQLRLLRKHKEEF